MSTELDCIVREEFASTVLNQTGSPGSGEEFRNQIQAAYEEVERGSYISNPLQVVLGRKHPELERCGPDTFVACKVTS